MAVLVMMCKTRILQMTTKDTEETFKDNQKKRIRRATNSMRIFYIATYIILGIRYIGSCGTSTDEKPPVPQKKPVSDVDEESFSFETDHYIYSGLKIFFLLLTAVYILLVRKSPYFECYQKSIFLVVSSLLLSIVTEVASLSIVEHKQSWQKKNMTLYNTLFFVDFLLIACLAYGAFQFRSIEVQIMIKLGIFKDIRDMNDKEMF